jgi:hypothetical protein
MQNNLTISRQLQRRFGSETGGYQILKIKRPRKDTPAWVNSDLKIQKLLLRAFPLMNTNLLQRERAGRWVRIIYLYFRQKWSRGQIAEEMKLSYSTVKGVIRSVKRVAEGKRADGRGNLIRTCPP